MEGFRNSEGGWEQLPKVAQSQYMERRVQEVVQCGAGSDGQRSGGLPGRRWCQVPHPLSSMRAQAYSSIRGRSQDGGTGGQRVGLGGRRAAALCSVRKLYSYCREKQDRGSHGALPDGSQARAHNHTPQPVDDTTSRKMRPEFGLAAP